MDPTLYVDVRCLQDYRYRCRGIGQHLTALLRTRAESPLSHWKAVGLADSGAPPLPGEWVSLFDQVTNSANPCANDGRSVFLDGTPMTHDTRFGLRFVGNPSFLSTAVVYDFIPLDWPGYLGTIPSRVSYCAQLARLRNFDLFFPISEYTAWRLSEILAVPRDRIRVTGAAVRQSLYEASNRISVDRQAVDKDPYFVAVVAADPRKNVELAVKAVRHLSLLYSQRIRLKVAGHGDVHFKNRLLEAAGHPEGQGFLELCFDASDDELMHLYAGAVATIVPSHIEGFSLPVVEATLCGCPVIASSCAAHLELFDAPDALFPSQDGGVLGQKLEAVLTSPSLRSSIVAAQAHLGHKFHENQVGQRFWAGIQDAVDRFSPFVTVAKRKKPRIAYLSPYPPDPSDAAFYTAMSIKAGVELFDADIYTDSPRPLVSGDMPHDAHRISVAPLLDNSHNNIISVLGNSASDAAFRFFERYGGPCILHELRLVEAYCRQLNHDQMMEFASAILGYPAGTGDLDLPFRDVEKSLLLCERVAHRATPLIVLSKNQQKILRDRCSVDAHVTTCCPSLVLSDWQRSAEIRNATRQRLGIAAETFLISSFGTPCVANSFEDAIMAMDFLRSWDIPAELFFVGDPGDQRIHLHNVADVFGVLDHVHCVNEPDDPATYSDFLIASDLVLQLRRYDFGSPSTHLCNAISAGVPSVAPDDMAGSCDAPGYVFTVPDYFSPLIVAERVATVWESKVERSSIEGERIEYLKAHNFRLYNSRLLEILNLA